MTEQELVNKQHEEHKALWLNREVANSYYNKAQKLSFIEDVGARRELRIELQEKYGVLEIEAINILAGKHIQEYVNKYYRIENRIPTERIRFKEPDEYPRFEEMYEYD